MRTPSWRQHPPHINAESRLASRWSVYGFSLRLRDDVTGALNMFRAEPGVFETEDVLAGRAMADIATIGIMHERLVREAELRADQLRHALDGRAAVERAKGVLAERHGVSLGEAFTLLWDHVRRNGRPLSEVLRGRPRRVG